MHPAHQEVIKRTAEILKEVGYEVAEDLTVYAPAGAAKEVGTSQRESLQLELLWDIHELLVTIANKD